jgi:hypothetical protein
MNFTKYDIPENEQEFIKTITPDNIYEKLKQVYEHDDDFDELFSMLPIPISENQYIKQTIQIDKELGWTKLKGYNPKESITYKLLTDENFYNEYKQKYVNNLKNIIEEEKQKLKKDDDKDDKDDKDKKSNVIEL